MCVTEPVSKGHSLKFWGEGECQLHVVFYTLQETPPYRCIHLTSRLPIQHESHGKTNSELFYLVLFHSPPSGIKHIDLKSLKVARQVRGERKAVAWELHPT